MYKTSVVMHSIKVVMQYNACLLWLVMNSIETPTLYRHVCKQLTSDFAGRIDVKVYVLGLFSPIRGFYDGAKMQPNFSPTFSHRVKCADWSHKKLVFLRHPLPFCAMFSMADMTWVAIWSVWLASQDPRLYRRIPYTEVPETRRG